MEVGDPFASVVPIPCSMVEPPGRLRAARLQAVSVTIGTTSWADCAEDHYLKQSGSRRENLQRSGSRAGGFQKPDATIPADG